MDGDDGLCRIVFDSIARAQTARLEYRLEEAFPMSGSVFGEFISRCQNICVSETLRPSPREFIGPPEELVFPRGDGHESTVKIYGKDLIGRGYWGNVYRARAVVSDPDNKNKGREHTVILKTFDTQASLQRGRGKDNIQARYNEVAYQKLKEAGVPLPFTFRREKNHPILLMTDLETDGWEVIGPSERLAVIDKRYDFQNNRSVSKDNFLKTNISLIHNFGKMLGSFV
jgi:hypothetical protein